MIAKVDPRTAKAIRWIFFFSSALLFLTFCMIVLGGIVKNSGSSLACPDWPTCNGTLMPAMTGGVAIEHSHRLLGTLIGILTIVIFALSLRARRADGGFVCLSATALVLVVGQGVLGGLTVLNKISPVYSSFHLGLSHLFFAVVLALYYRSCAYRETHVRALDNSPRKLRIIALIAVVLVFVQILLGGIVRHFGAGPACGLGRDAMWLCQELSTGVHTIWPENGPGQLHMLHRLNGIFVLFALIGLTIPVLKYARLNRLMSLRRLLIGIHVVVTFQILLGLEVVRSGISPHAITLHLAVALVLWAFVVSLYIKLSGSKGLCCGA